MVSKAGNDGERACLVLEDCVSGLERYKCVVYFLMEDGWLDRGLNFLGGPGVLVLLAEVNQGSID